jgi:putative hemolysin
MALQHAEWIAVRMAVPMTIISKVTRPLVAILTGSTEVLLRLFGRHRANNSAVTEDDIRQLVRGEPPKVGRCADVADAKSSKASLVSVI